MKTVSGKVISTRPISLSRAAKLISAFTASDNEASPAFSAYLKRTSAAFNQLVHLHKDCNLPLTESRNKKDRSTSRFITLGTPNSSKVTDDAAVNDNDRSHDAINANEVKDDDMGSPNADGEKKKKKKKKIDKIGKENPVVASETVQEKKKHKKSKVKEVKETGQKDDGNVESKNDVSDGKKHKKKTSHETEIRENGCSVETEAADKKANRKRKHERVVDGELESSQEAVRTKKKKYNHSSR